MLFLSLTVLANSITTLLMVITISKRSGGDGFRMEDRIDLWTVLRKVKSMDQAYTDLKNAVSNLTTVDQSAITLINGIAQRIQAALDSSANDAEALNAVREAVSTINADAANLAAAVAANTPAETSTTVPSGDNPPVPPSDQGAGVTIGEGGVTSGSHPIDSGVSTPSGDASAEPVDPSNPTPVDNTTGSDVPASPPENSDTPPTDSSSSSDNTSPISGGPDGGVAGSTTNE